MYTDLQDAFGDNLGLATRHYIEFGYNEGREYKWTKVSEAEDNLFPDGIYTYIYPEGGYRKYEIKNGVERWSD